MTVSRLSADIGQIVITPDYTRVNVNNNNNNIGNIDCGWHVKHYCGVFYVDLKGDNDNGFDYVSYKRNVTIRYLK